jgi:DNA helicase-2/ATP-dependent DNA helicase PcrA
LDRESEAELKAVSLSLAPGDTVTHDNYGLGTVVSMSGSGADTEAMIDFGAELGVKHLVLGYAPLKKF